MNADAVREIIGQIRQLRTQEAETEGFLRRLAEEQATAEREAVEAFGTADPAALRALLTEAESAITAAAERAEALLRGETA